MADFSTFAHGGVTYPLTSSTVNPLLNDADPAIFYILDYYTSIIRTHVGPRLLAQAALVLPTIIDSVASVVPYDPTPYLTESQFTFPLLAVYRQTSTFKMLTTTWMHDVAEIGVNYVLPPLTAGQAEALVPILRSVEATVLNRTENMFDPGYASGAKPWALANIQEISLVKSQYGSFPGLVANLWFPSIKFTLAVKERQMPITTAFSTFAGTDTTFDLASSTDPPVLAAASTRVTFIDPTTIPTLVLYARGDAGITAATDGIHASTWANQSGTGSSFTAPTAAPTIVYGAVTTTSSGVPVPKSVLRFDRLSSEYMQATVTALATDTGKTIVVLARLLATAPRQAIVSQTLTADTGAHTVSLAANVTSTAGNKFGIEAAGSTYDTPAITDTSWHVFAVRESNTTSAQTITTTTDVHIDGVNAQPLTSKSGAGTWQGMTTANLLTLGGSPGDGSNYASVDIGVVLAFSSSLSDANLTLAIKYCQQWLGNY